MNEMNSETADVLISIRFFEESAVDLMEQHGLRVVRADIAYDALDTEVTPAMHRALSQVQAWILGTAPVTRELLRRYPNLKVVARRGVGFNSVDTQAIRDLGRILTITPGGNEPAVADHTLALMLSASKRVVESHTRLQSGRWQAIVGTELHEKTVGLIGFGRIGRLVARRLQGFDVKVLVHDPYLDAQQAQEAGVVPVSLVDLLKLSDFISLHAPLTDQTRHLLNTQSLRLVKPSAILVNTSRAELIDERALLLALQEERLAGAGLDVFACESDATMQPVADALLKLPNVVGTPHTAASTSDSLHRSNMKAAECVIAALAGKPVPPNCVVVDGRDTEVA
jgi:D-3-phosphoglycerate dehydrogenase